jgi:hypothetical protein
MIAERCSQVLYRIHLPFTGKVCSHPRLIPHKVSGSILREQELVVGTPFRDVSPQAALSRLDQSPSANVVDLIWKQCCGITESMKCVRVYDPAKPPGLNSSVESRQ